MSRLDKSFRDSRYNGLIGALIISNVVSVALLLVRTISTSSSWYWFMLWNLLLAWLPLLFAVLLVKGLKSSRWMSPRNVLLSFLWIGFLPNSFYMVSDLIHVNDTGVINVLFDAVMLTSFVFNGLVAGFMSLYLVHKELLKRFTIFRTTIMVTLILLVSSFAVYLGRVLRWNTWDVVIHPFGIIFDVSEQVINPSASPQAVMTTTTFFLLTSSMYLVIWQFVKQLRRSR